MADKQSKKLILFNILDILRKYTDENHRLSQKEIQDKLAEEYGMALDRKTIKTSLMNLEEFGYDLEYSETSRPVKNKKTGAIESSVIYSDFYLQRDFDDSELRLLIDSLLFSQHLPYSQCKELVEKLEGLSNVYFKSRIKHIAAMPQDRTNNKQLFLTIDLIDEAISKGKKIQFKYLEYKTDLTQAPKKVKNSQESRIYLVSPYQMAAKEGKYYLICNYDPYDDISNYRLDRMTDVELMEESAKPFENLKGSGGQRLNLSRYMAEHIYMYSSDTSRVKLRIANAMISDIIDIFGSEVSFTDQDEQHVTVRVKGSERAILQFAKNYAPDVVVLEPERLRQQAIEELKQGLRSYEK